VAGSTKIVVVDIATLVMTTVSSIEDGGDVSPPSWSPDGTSLTYARASPERLGARIEVAPVDGGLPVQLVTGLGPSWSPDGAWIAYWKRGYEVWLVHPDGSDAHFLTSGFSPSWTEDPRSVVVSVPHRRISTIDRIDIEDGHRIELLSQGQQGAISPDGSLLGLLREVRPLQLRLWIGPVSAPDRMAQLIRQEVITFSWFPDGSRLAVEIPTPG
jgi:dipeptidyl aminopeptidase/acylaminoacyl peptidase